VGTTLSKLGYKAQPRVLMMRAPDEMADLRTALEDGGAAVDVEPDGIYPLVIVFARSMAEAHELAPIAAEALDGDGLVWLGYPKQSSKRYKADINRDKTWGIFQPVGLRPVAQVSIDEDWSAIRLRREEHVGT
jgi:hypothetical protein